MSSKTVIAVAVDQLPSDQVNDFIKQLFDQLQREVLARPHLSSIELAYFQNEANNMRLQLAEILNRGNNRQRDAAQRAVASALCLSFYHAGGTQVLRELQHVFRHNQTKPARVKRGGSGLVFKTIVDGELQKRAGSPKHANKPRTIAHNIYPAVAAKVEQLSSKPRWWPPKEMTKTGAPETENEAEVRRIEAIRKQIERKRQVDP